MNIHELSINLILAGKALLQAGEALRDGTSIAHSLDATDFTAASATTQSAVPSQESDATLTIDFMRAELKALAKKDFSRDIKCLINQFGGQKLSDINPCDYADLLAAAKALDHDRATDHKDD